MNNTFTQHSNKSNGASPQVAGNYFGYKVAATTIITLESTTPSANDSVSGKLVCGVGINDLPGHSSYRDPESGKLREQLAYAAWKIMINRAYSAKIHARCPTYIGCSVHPDWLRLSGFKAWFDVNHVAGWSLDKDLMCVGNKVYGPEHCRYVPPYLNLIVTDSAASRGKFPLGVTKQNPGTKYVAHCRVAGTQKRLGVFSDPLSAHRAWQEAKADGIDDALRRYTKERVVHLEVVRALIHYADRLRADAKAGRETKGFSA
jgi:hypothetical protein